jgi:hypothetical protein
MATATKIRPSTSPSKTRVRPHDDCLLVRPDGSAHASVSSCVLPNIATEKPDQASVSRHV